MNNRMHRLSEIEKSQYFDKIMLKYQDLRIPKAERSFFANETFRNEITLEPGEKLFYLSHQNLWIVLITGALPILIMLFLLLFGYYQIRNLIIEDEAGALLVVFISGFILLLIYGIPLGIRILQSKSFRYIITDRRIIIGYTFLQRWTRLVEYSNLVDIVVHQPMVPRLFRSGHILFITSSNEGPYMGGSTGGGGIGMRNMMNIKGFMNVRNPFRLKKMIREIKQIYTEEQALPPPLLSRPISNPSLKHVKEIGLTEEEHVFKVYEKKRSSSLIKGLFTWLGIPIYIIISIGDLNILTFITPALLTWIGIILVAGVVIIIIFSKYHAQGFEFVITDKRIIMLKKFFSITIRDVIMGKITDVSIFQMAAGRVANFGVINIRTKGFESMFRFRDLYHIQGVPDVVKEKDDIRNMVLYFQRGRLYSPELEMFDPEFLNL